MTTLSEDVLGEHAEESSSPSKPSGSYEEEDEEEGAKRTSALSEDKRRTPGKAPVEPGTVLDVKLCGWLRLEDELDDSNFFLMLWRRFLVLEPPCSEGGEADNIVMSGDDEYIPGPVSIAFLSLEEDSCLDCDKNVNENEQGKRRFCQCEKD